MSEIVTVREKDDIRILDVNCDLDVYTAVQFRKKLESLGHQKIYKLIVNLSNAEYISSTAVGALVWFSAQARQKWGDLKVYGLTDSLQRTFDLVGASKIIEVYNSEKEAIDSF